MGRNPNLGVLARERRVRDKDIAALAPANRLGTIVNSKALAGGRASLDNKIKRRKLKTICHYNYDLPQRYVKPFRHSPNFIQAEEFFA
jgi:hypothetical protein